MEGAAAAVPFAVDAVDRNRHLEAVVLVVRDLGLMGQVHVTDRERAKRTAADRRCGSAGVALPHRLFLGRDLERRHLFPIFAGRTQEPPGHETVSVGVDQVARDVLAQRDSGRPGQVEGERPRMPCRHLGHRLDGPCLKPVAGEEALRRQHVERVGVMVPLGVAAVCARLSLEPLDQAVTTVEESVVLRVERAVLAAGFVQPLHLGERPLQPPPQRPLCFLEAGGEGVDAAAQRLWRNRRGVRCWPTLGESRFGFGEQGASVPADDLSEGPEVERHGTHGVALEQPGRDAARQAAFERRSDLLLLGRGRPAACCGVFTAESLQRGEDRGVHMLADHHVVAQVEGGRVDSAGKQLLGLSEVGAVVRHGPAVREIDGHPMTSAGAAGSLPVVGGQGRYVAHQHRIQGADVHPEFKGRGADEAVHRVASTLEQVLQPFPLLIRNHRRVLLRAQHGVAAVQELQVVVIRVFAQPFQLAVAPPRRAAVVRRPADRAGAATAAAVDAAMGRQLDPVGVDLVDAAGVRHRAATGAQKLHLLQQAALGQHLEQAPQHLFRLFRLGAPLRGHLPHRGLAALAQPLQDAAAIVAGAAFQLDALRSAGPPKIALLDLEVAGEAVPGEGQILRVVEDLLPANVVECRGDPLAHGFRRQPEPVCVVLDPRQRSVQVGVVDLHSPPGFQPQGLPGGLRDLAQHLHAQELPPLVAVALAGCLPARHYPNLRDQRARECLVLLQSGVEEPGQIAYRPVPAAQSVRHQRPQAKPACVVLHPSGLEGGILAVVAEHEQPPPLRLLDHVLGQNVHVGGGAGAHGPRRFAVAAATAPAAQRVAREAARQDPGPVRLLTDGVKADSRPGRAAGEAVPA